MLAAALLLCLASQDLEATLTASVPEAAIGEPVEWTLTVHHDRDESLELSQPELAPDASWVQLEGPRSRREQLSDRARTIVRWKLMSLEPGERELPVPGFELSSGVEVKTTPGHLTVTAELAADEDAPRGLAGLHDAPLPSGRWRGAVWVVPALWLACSALTTFLIVRSGRRKPDAPRSAADALRALGGPHAGEQRTWMFEFTTLLRAACDETAGTPRPGRTDDEWLADHAAERALPEGVLEDMRELLATGTDVKYGGVELTSFAIDELNQRAAGVLERLPAAEARA